MSPISWDNPTRFVVTGMAVLFVVAWVMSLSPLLNIHFYSAKYALRQLTVTENDQVQHCTADPDLGNSTTFCEIGASYYQPKRYVWFFPHVLAAFVWWNLYFWQLIPYIRHRFPKLHRYMGRLLMVTALVQVVTGSGLATTSSSPIIKVVSWMLALAVTYTLYRAWTAVRAKDYATHKHWAMRLVGYLQTIALQRFYLLVLILTHQAEWHVLYPPFVEDNLNEDDYATQQQFNNAIVRSMFDTSFVMAIVTAILITEWYLCNMSTTATNVTTSNQHGGTKPLTGTMMHGTTATLSEQQEASLLAYYYGSTASDS